MKKFWKLTAAVLCLSGLVGLTGCVKKDSIKIREIENFSVTMRDGIGINVVVRVENSAGSNIKISDIQLEVSDLHGNGIGELWVNKELVIPRRSETSIVVPIKVKLDNPLAGMGVLRNLTSAADKYIVNGSARMKSGMFGKKVVFDNVPLSEILAIFDPPKPITDPMIN